LHARTLDAERFTFNCSSPAHAPAVATPCAPAAAASSCAPVAAAAFGAPLACCASLLLPDAKKNAKKCEE
jgi:hypothetical protein